MDKPTDKACMVCKELFTPFRTTQRTCTTPACMIEWARQRAEKKAERQRRVERREARERLKTRSEWVREAQRAFNAYIRRRDSGKPCVSCGRHHRGQIHAGHYRTTKAEPALRFHPFNCHSQCQPCNTHLSGNIVEYRLNLKERIGEKNLEWLEGPHQAQHLSIEDLIEIRSYYREALKALGSE